MLTLEVVVQTLHSLKVVELMAGLRFTGGDLTRKDGRDTFRFEGDEQTLREAQRRLEAVPFAICVRQEIVEDEDAGSEQEAVMKLAQGDMWSVYDQADLFLVTTNSVLNRHRALVMGAGIARQARERFPGLDTALGKAVMLAGTRYGLLVSPHWPRARLGEFQTKVHWHDTSSLELIVFSTRKLLAWCDEHPTARVHLNMPGVGLGGLTREQVLPALERLPDAVTVWAYRNS